MASYVVGVIPAFTPGVMPGVTRQAIGVHSGNAVSFGGSRSIDRRDYSTTPREEPHYFDCSEVVHFTENKFAESIGALNDRQKLFSFRAKPWWITPITSLKLSWWSPVPPHSWQEQLKLNVSNTFAGFDDIGNSAAFNGLSLCGPIGFAIKWEAILQQYAISRQKCFDDVEFRTFGTFRYRSEIMYAVLVCIKGDLGVAEYPIIGTDGTEAFKPVTSGSFTWKVYSSVGFSSSRNREADMTWDHVSFGFNCPTSDLIIDPTFCRITQKDSTRHMPFSRFEQFEIRAQEDMLASERVMDLLQQKISLYLYDFYLYGL